MDNAVFDKTMEKLTNATDIRLVSNKKDYLNAHQNQVICHKKKNLQWFSCKSYINAQQTSICWDVYIRFE